MKRWCSCHNDTNNRVANNLKARPTACLLAEQRGSWCFALGAGFLEEGRESGMLDKEGGWSCHLSSLSCQKRRKKKFNLQRYNSRKHDIMMTKRVFVRARGGVDKEYPSLGEERVLFIMAYKGRLHLERAPLSGCR